MNATLNNFLHAATGGGLSLAAGLVLLAGLLAWLVVEVFRAGLRLIVERNQSRVALDKLRAQLDEVHQEADGIELGSGDHHLHLVVVAVDVLALPLVSAQRVSGRERILNRNFKHFTPKSS